MTWQTCPVICAICSHRWQAVIDGAWDGEPALECPECGSQSGVKVEDEDEEAGPDVGPSMG